jgi:hypothetical protein
VSGAGKSADKDVAEDRSELDETTPAFVELFMKKVKRLEEYGSKTQWPAGESACPEKQWPACSGLPAVGCLQWAAIFLGPEWVI